MEQIKKNVLQQPKLISQSLPNLNITNSGEFAALKIEPSNIKFESIQCGVLYVMTFSIRNTTKIAQRIRIQAPKSGFFALNYIPSGPVAPGLDIRAEIECQVPAYATEMMFTDKVTIVMGKHQFELPLYACKPYASIKMEEVLDFGNIIRGQSISKDLIFENIGNFKGFVKISSPTDPNLKFFPSRFELDAQGSSERKNFAKVNVSFIAKNLGHLRELLNVTVSNGLQDLSLDVSANIVDQKLSLLSEKDRSILENVSLGNIFFGHVRSINACLVNSGPNALSFSINYEEDEENVIGNLSGGTSDVNGDESVIYAKALSMNPIDGIVKPFSQLSVVISFKPTLIVPEKGFYKQQDAKDNVKSIFRRAIIDCPDIDQKIYLSLQGNAIIPSIVANPIMLRYGDCSVNDRRDILVTLTNKTKLPTSYEFPTIPCFKFTPSRGVLQSLETISIVTSFLPPQLGKFKNKLQMLVAEGLDTIEFKLLGECDVVGAKKTLIGGTDKQPEDFKPMLKFVDPREEQEARVQKKTIQINKIAAFHKSLQVPSEKQSLINFTNNNNNNNGKDLVSIGVMNSVTSQERNYIYKSTTVSLIQSKSLEMINDSLMQKKENEVGYNKFLQQSYHKRLENKKNDERQKMLAKGAINFDDPFGVNMGMERGLDEPFIPLPAVTEPLWLANRGVDGGGAQNRLPIDENRLIQKKYGSNPSTQAELRDCTAELSSDEAKLICASHKTIDFGKVNVGSLSAKNFVVSNDLKRSVLVKIEDLEPELQQSKALSQVIPEGCVAGFDVYFCSRTIGKFKRSFTWKINGFHSSKCFVLADVVPIELVLSKQVITMEFAQDSLMSSLTQEILITNPGNAHGEFLWGNAGAFHCTPERGTINPGKSTVVAIRWTPSSGKRNEEELGLHVTGGLDQTLKVIGVLKETKAEFIEKRLSLGVMAVGTEKTVTAHIKNVSLNPLVFFVNSIDDKLGLTVSPMVESILPGEKVAITLSFIPRYAMSYDNLSISAKIRGGKQINVKFNGSSMIPQLELCQKDFSFGTVAIGCEYRLPLTIVNKTAITTTLVLDLNAYPDFKPNLIASSSSSTTTTSNAFDDADEEQEDLSGGFLQFNSNKSQFEDRHGNSIKLFNTNLKNKTHNNNNNNNNNESNSKKNHRTKGNNFWKISITGNSTLNAELIFHPSLPRSHSFKLLLYLQGISKDQTLVREVTAQAVASILEVSSFVVDFGDKVVSRDPLSRLSYFLETSVKNLSTKKGISYEIREGTEKTREFGKKPAVNESNSVSKGKKGSSTSSDEVDKSPMNQIFFVSPTKGDLAPGSSFPLRITFQPQSSGDYSKKLDIYIKDQPDQTRPYLTILCLGSGLFPRLSFNMQHLELPTVPLGVSSRAGFTIFNHGYDSLAINYNTSPNIPMTLEISYPDGKDLGIMIDKIRVIVSAKSNVSTSWSGKIEFFDKDGERFFITVSGCTDCCLLTNYPFIRLYSDMYGFIGLDDQPVRFLKKTEIAELRAEEAKRKTELRKQRSIERQKAVEGKTNNAKGDSSVTTDTQKKGNNNKKTQQDGSTASNTNNINSSSSSMKGTTLRNDSISSLSEPIDIDRMNEKNVSFFDDSEAIFLLKWLNKNIICKKQFDADRFPHCMYELNGDLVMDFFEQMSGRKLPAVIKNNTGENVVNDGTTNAFKARTGEPVSNETTEKNNKNSEKNGKIVVANRLVYKYQQILNFLINNGALLGHVNPINLVSLDDHIIAQEYELTRDRSLRFTPAMLNERRITWEDSWLQCCKRSWLDVLYQAVKIYILARVNYKDYISMPGVVLSTKDDLPDEKTTLVDTNQSNNATLVKVTKKKKALSSVPKDMVASNVFTQSEAVLLAWSSYHMERAGSLPDEGASGGESTRMLNFSNRLTDLDADFKDMIGFLQLIHSHLSDFTNLNEPLAGYTTLDRSKKDETFEILEQSLTQLRMDFGMKLSEITTSTRSILLMVLHLFFHLPNLVPKTKVEFVGQLGSLISKKIELKNPSKKAVVYEPTIRGSSDFTIDTTCPKLVIPPESSIEYLVSLNARFFDSVSAKLTFWGLRESGASGSTLSFNLVSNMTGRKPTEKIVRSVSLHELETFRLEIKNPCGKDAVFHIQLQVQHIPMTIDETIKTANNTKNTNSLYPNTFKPSVFLKPLNEDVEELLTPMERKNSEEEREIEEIFKQPFWCNEEHISLPKTGSKFLNVQMLPFLLGKYYCQVVFIEKDTGEFCYEIGCEVGFPKPVEKLEFTAQKHTKIFMSAKLASKNLSFDKALSLLTDLRIKNNNKKTRARSVLQNLLASPIVNDETGQSHFIVDFLPSFFVFKKQIPFVSEYITHSKPIVGNITNAIATNTTTTTIGRGNSSNIINNTLTSSASNTSAKVKKTLKSFIEKSSTEDINNTVLNAISLQFTPDRAGQYSTKAVIFPKENQYDVRVVEITAKVTVADTKMVLEFRGPARQKITQEIPIQNGSNNDWQLVSSITGKCFTGPKYLSVKKNDSAVFAITFNTANSGKFEGNLVLRNTDGDTFNYHLVGIGEDPLAEENLVFKCACRKPEKFSINLQPVQIKPVSVTTVSVTSRESNLASNLASKSQQNIQTSQKYEVESDIPYLSGADSIVMDATAGAVYDFVINSPVGGVLSGFINFKNVDTGVVLWYTVTIEVSSPSAERVIDVQATVRTAVAIEITLENPTDDLILFNVFMEGDGLLGENTFELYPKSSTEKRNETYELIYSPLLTGNFVGKVNFSNDTVGDLWYKLNLTALPASPTVVDTIECMVGLTKSIRVSIENPLPNSVSFQAECSNPNHFFVTNEKITLGAYQQSDFEVKFCPSSFNEVMQATIKLINFKFGEMQYLVSGVGFLPGIMPTTIIDAPLNEIGSSTIVFRNPFSHPLPIEVVLAKQTNNLKQLGTVKNEEKNDVGSAFALLLRKTSDIVLQPKGTIHIAVSFSPDRLTKFEAAVEVRSMVLNRNLLWCFPITGLTEAGESQRFPGLKTQSKSSLLKEIIVPLEGLHGDSNGTNELDLENFSVEVKTDDKNKSLVMRSFRIQAVELLKISPSEAAAWPGHEATEYAMKYRLLFEPLRTFSTEVEVVISCHDRGKWKLQMDLEALEPLPDDTIKLTAPVGGVDRVSFKLNNRFLGYSNFKAYFSVKSSPHFTVSPSSGVLAPYGSSDGTKFVITFSPLGYGTVENGILIISTDDAQWNYEIKGFYPDSTINQASVKSKVDSNRDKNIGSVMSNSFYK